MKNWYVCQGGTFQSKETRLIIYIGSLAKINVCILIHYLLYTPYSSGNSWAQNHLYFKNVIDDYTANYTVKKILMVNKQMSK